MDKVSYSGGCVDRKVERLRRKLTILSLVTLMIAEELG